MLTHLSGEGVIFRSLASRTGRAWDLGMPSPMGQECLLSAEIWLLQSAGLQLYYAVWASSMQFELHSRSSERYHLSCLAPAENAQHIVHRTFFPQRLARAASHHCHFGQSCRRRIHWFGARASAFGAQKSQALPSFGMNVARCQKHGWRDHNKCVVKQSTIHRGMLNRLTVCTRALMRLTCAAGLHHDLRKVV